MAVSQPPHTDAISARNAAGKSAVMAASGAGLPVVTDLGIGTAALTGVRATSSSRVARTATTRRSADAVARGYEKGK